MPLRRSLQPYEPGGDPARPERDRDSAGPRRQPVDGKGSCNSSDNFWRSLSNLTINVDRPASPPAYVPPVVDAAGTGCANSAEMWSASQAAHIRRAIINGSVVFQDSCSGHPFAGGGYGLGSYVAFVQTTSTLVDTQAFQAPDTRGVRFHDVFTVWISGSGGDNSVINGVGGPANSTRPGRVEPIDVVSYP